MLIQMLCYLLIQLRDVTFWFSWWQSIKYTGIELKPINLWKYSWTSFLWITLLFMEDSRAAELHDQRLSSTSTSKYNFSAARDRTLWGEALPPFRIPHCINTVTIAIYSKSQVRLWYDSKHWIAATLHYCCSFFNSTSVAALLMLLRDRAQQRQCNKYKLQEFSYFSLHICWSIHIFNENWTELDFEITKKSRGCDVIAHYFSWLCIYVWLCCYAVFYMVMEYRNVTYRFVWEKIIVSYSRSCYWENYLIFIFRCWNWNWKFMKLAVKTKKNHIIS